MAMLNAQKAKVLDHYYGGTVLEVPDYLYVGLSVASPSLQNLANPPSIGEPGEGSGYARVEIANDTTTWEYATQSNPSVKTNAIPIEFPEATGNWGGVCYWALYEQQTGGVCVEWGELTDTKVIMDGDTARFKPGEMRILLRDSESN